MEATLILFSGLPGCGYTSLDNAHFQAIVCYCSDEALWRSRMQEHIKYVPGWTAVDWQEVEHLRPLYDPWERQSALRPNN